MADHGEVEYATATGKDSAEHEGRPVRSYFFHWELILASLSYCSIGGHEQNRFRSP
jgi:hypothetical protein